jgi:hypothetical protein
MERGSGSEPSDLPAMRRSSAIRRLAPLAILLIAIGTFFALGLHHYLSFETLRQHRETLLALVERQP